MLTSSTTRHRLILWRIVWIEYTARHDRLKGRPMHGTQRNSSDGTDESQADGGDDSYTNDRRDRPEKYLYISRRLVF
eukprot:scaffold326972_cov28-Prasinocladus_malaysianus.AAC.1